MKKRRIDLTGVEITLICGKTEYCNECVLLDNVNGCLGHTGVNDYTEDYLNTEIDVPDETYAVDLDKVEIKEGDK